MKLIGAGNHIHSLNSLKSRLRISAIQSCLLLALLVSNQNSVRGQGVIDFWSPNPGLTNGWETNGFILYQPGDTNSLDYTLVTYNFETFSNVLGNFPWSVPNIPDWNNLLITNRPNVVILTGDFGFNFPSFPPPLSIPQLPAAFNPIPDHSNVGQPVLLQVTESSTTDPLASVEFYAYQMTGIAVDTGTSDGGVQITAPPIYAPVIESSSLGSVSHAPFQKIWIPSNPGIFAIWARLIGESGAIFDLRGQTIRIGRANDDFAQAEELDPAITATNIAFNTAGTSVESTEPLRRKTAPRQTLWWKWTPSQTIKMRFKAVRNSLGLPLEIFTGNELSDLRRLAHNNRSASVMGKTGVVELKVRAGRTYFIRVSEDAHTTMFGYSSANTANLILEPAANPLPGELDFSLIAGNVPRLNVVIPFGRVFRPNGRTPLVGSQYRAQLYVGGTKSALSPVGHPTSFFNETQVNQMPSLAGLFFPDVVVLPEIRAGHRVFAQIRVWDSTFGESLEEAQANGSPVGISRVISVTTGSEKSNPGRLFGIGSFKISQP